MGGRIAGPVRVFQLSYAAIEDTLEVVVDSEVVEPDLYGGWICDADFWMVRLDGDYLPPPGSQITITYTIAGG